MDLRAEIRDAIGKKVGALRRSGFIPGELYGHKVENVHLSVPIRDFMGVFKEAGMNTLVTLSVGENKRPVLIHDVQRDYLSNEVLHVDFYEVSLTEEIKAKVPLEFVGEAPAVKEKGGIVNKVVTELEVQALPHKLPHRLSVSLGRLVELNDSFYVRDLEVPSGVTILVESETVLVTVTPPMAEEEPTPVPTDVTAIKVEDEEKKAKRVQEKEAQAKEEA